MARPASRTVGFAALAICAALVRAVAGARGGEHVLAVLRVLDAEGATVAADALELEATERDAQAITVWLPRLEPLGDGGLRIDLDEPAPDAERTLVIATAERGASGPGARIDVSKLAAGEHDLGVVRLAPPPRLAEGRVIDASGTPVASASVRVERRWMGPATGPATWNPVTSVHARTDREGKFVLSGWVGTDELKVVAQAPGLAPASREVRAGATGVEVPLAATGAIEGSVLVDARCGRGAVWVECVRDGSALGGAASPIEGDGTFAIADQPEGAYTVRFRAEHDVAPILAIDGVLVRSGLAAADARLRGVDLRGRVRCLRVRVTARGGEAIPWFLFGVREPGAAGELREFWASGDFAVSTASPEIDLRVFAKGYRTARVDRIDGDRAIELVPGLPVRIVLEGGAPPMPEGLALSARLEPLEPESRVPQLAVVPFDARGEALVPACDAGDLRLALSVRREATDEDVSILAKIATPDSIRVEAREGEQRVSVKLDRDALRRALEGLERGG